MARVPSVLALSATVIRNRYGNAALRWAYRRRSEGSRSTCSLWTGTTTSSTGPGAVSTTDRPRWAGPVGMVVAVMHPPSGGPLSHSCALAVPDLWIRADQRVMDDADIIRHKLGHLFARN